MSTTRTDRISTVKRIALAKGLFQWQPHASQREWMLDDHQVKVAACGRRWGKTESAAVDVATYAIAHKGSIQMIVAPTYDQSRLISDRVERLLLSNSLTRRHLRVTKTPYPDIRYRESRITARTADDDGRNLRGNCADRVIVDEAAFVRDVVIAEVIGPMLADRNGQLVMISTPFGKNHFYRAFLEGQKGSPEVPGSETPIDGGRNLATVRTRSFRFPSWANPHISREYIDFQQRVLTERQFKVEYEAEFVDDQSAVFPWNHIEAAFEPQSDPGLGARSSGNFARVAGIDWARYSDYTAIVILAVNTEQSIAGDDPILSSGRYRLLALDRFGGMEWGMQVERITSLLQTYGVISVAADQTSVGDPVLEMLKNVLQQRNMADIDLEGVVFTNQTKRELVDNLAIRLANREVRFPYIEQLVRELQFYEYEVTEAGNIRTRARHGYHDDCVMALALALRAAAKYGLADRFATSGRRRVSIDSW